MPVYDRNRKVFRRTGISKFSLNLHKLSALGTFLLYFNNFDDIYILMMELIGPKLYAVWGLILTVS